MFPGRSGRSNSSTYRVKIQRDQNMVQKIFRKEIKIWRTEPRDRICENQKGQKRGISRQSTENLLGNATIVGGAKLAISKYLQLDDYFELKTIKAQKTQEETLTFPHLPKIIYIEDLFPKQSYHQGHLQRIWAKYSERNSAEPRYQSPFHDPLSLHGPPNINYQIFVFRFPCELPPTSLKSPKPQPNILFSL